MRKMNSFYVLYMLIDYILNIITTQFKYAKLSSVNLRNSQTFILLMYSNNKLFIL